MSVQGIAFKWGFWGERLVAVVDWAERLAWYGVESWVSRHRRRDVVLSCRCSELFPDDGSKAVQIVHRDGAGSSIRFRSLCSTTKQNVVIKKDPDRRSILAELAEVFSDASIASFDPCDWLLTNTE